MNDNRQVPLMSASTNNNKVQQDKTDQVDLVKLKEQERSSQVSNQQAPKENHSTKQQFFPSSNEIYSDAKLKLSSQTKPFRIIIIRHAERVDAVLGSDWSRKSFDRAGRYIRFSEHLPDRLPSRSYLHHYVIDVPLTNRGRLHAFKTGRALLNSGYTADICYTSPSLRCVQSADAILYGMGRRNVSMQLEPGLFECYLNDFKRTLCFMTKDELAANGYNIDKSYQSLMPFMRPHDSQTDYYERCRFIMNVIMQRHQRTGGTVLVVAHAPSLEGLTRHLSGGRFQPDKLFDIARRVPFLAMTIIEKHSINSPWLFRTEPLQTNIPQAISDITLELTQPSKQPPIPPRIISPLKQQEQQIIQQNQIAKPRLPGSSAVVDRKKLVKSSTAPNLRTSYSSSEMFHVI